jgi:hypothetical protein
MLMFEIPKWTCSLLSGFDQLIALVLLHFHPHCKANGRQEMFGSVTLGFAAYWEFGDIEM